MDQFHLNQTSSTIIRAALEVHSTLGPGLLESAYQACLAHALRKAGLRIVRERVLPVEYDGIRIDAGYRIDLLVEDVIIVEVKSVERLLPIHHAQLLSYLRLSGKNLGLLINFNVPRLGEGIKRIVNSF